MEDCLCVCVCLYESLWCLVLHQSAWNLAWTLLGNLGVTWGIALCTHKSQIWIRGKFFYWESEHLKSIETHLFFSKLRKRKEQNAFEQIEQDASAKHIVRGSKLTETLSTKYKAWESEATQVTFTILIFEFLKNILLKYDSSTDKALRMTRQSQ